MQEIIISLINKFGYIGIMTLVALENIFPPIPSEVILGFSGFISKISDLKLIGVIVFSTIGSIIGAVILYIIGRFLNKDRLIKIINGKVGKILFLKEKDIIKSNNWFTKNGNKAVFICRFVPIVRSLISLPAGMNKMNVGIFLFYTLVGSLIWNSILVVLGMMLGNNWEVIIKFVNNYTLIVLIIGFIILALYLIKRVKKG